MLRAQNVSRQLVTIDCDPRMMAHSETTRYPSGDKFPPRALIPPGGEPPRPVLRYPWKGEKVWPRNH